jgi:hypothetical protein
MRFCQSFMTVSAEPLLCYPRCACSMAWALSHLGRRSCCWAFIPLTSPLPSAVKELHRHIGAYIDVPAGDIGVGGKEIGEPLLPSRPASWPRLSGPLLATSGLAPDHVPASGG